MSRELKAGSAFSAHHVTGTLLGSGARIKTCRARRARALAVRLHPSLSGPQRPHGAVSRERLVRLGRRSMDRHRPRRSTAYGTARETASVDGDARPSRNGVEVTWAPRPQRRRCASAGRRRRGGKPVRGAAAGVGARPRVDADARRREQSCRAGGREPPRHPRGRRHLPVLPCRRGLRQIPARATARRAAADRQAQNKAIFING